MREVSIGLPLNTAPSLSQDALCVLTRPGITENRDPGETIYTQGEAATSVLIIDHGQVKSVLVDEAGVSTLLRLHLSHSVLGLSALGTRPVRDATAIALGPVRLIRVEAADVQAALREHPDIAASIIRLLVDRMSDFHHRVGTLANRPVRERLEHVLIALSRPEPGQTSRQPIRLTHEDLANLTGTRRQTVTSLLRDLEASNLITRPGRAIHVNLGPAREMSAP